MVDHIHTARKFDHLGTIKTIGHVKFDANRHIVEIATHEIVTTDDAMAVFKEILR
jgi:hypothetical protein